MPLILNGCAETSSREEHQTTEDLIQTFATAEVRTEVGTIDPGNPAHRRYLPRGWYSPAWQRSSDRSLAWSRGQESIVEFFLTEKRDLQVDLRCAPFSFGDGRQQSMTFELNGHAAGDIALVPGMRLYSIQLPQQDVMVGRNRLRFRYRYVSSPESTPSGRRLAVVWDFLRLSPMEQPSAPAARLDHERRGIYIPIGSQVDYFLELHHDSALMVTAEAGADAARSRLEIAVQMEGKPEEEILRRLTPGADDAEIRLPGEGRRLLRLALRSIGSEHGSPPPPGILVSRLEVRSEAPTPTVERPWTASGEQPNIVIYLVDALRADRLGAYGYRRPVSPSIDRFAAGSLVFEHAIAQAPWTRPAVASLLTGLGPWRHGVRTLEDRLAEEAVTLPERLQSLGYRTAAFSTNWHVREATGLAQGFDDFLLLAADDWSSEAVNRRVFAWLDSHRSNAPFFLYIHTLDPHAPYEPPKEFRQRFAEDVTRPGAGSIEDLKRIYARRGSGRSTLVADLPSLYDAEVAFNDSSFGALIQGLRDRGLYQEALIIFLSDHGEEFDEHGSVGHAQNLYAPVLDIPLIVRLPHQQRGRRIRHLAQQIDVVPTILAYLGLSASRPLPGINLLTLSNHKAEEGFGGRIAVSHLSYDGREGFSVVQGPWKRIEPRSVRFGRQPELYWLGSDRSETVNLIDRFPVRSGYLASLLKARLDTDQWDLPAEKEEIDDGARRALQAIGYL